MNATTQTDLGPLADAMQRHPVWTEAEEQEAGKALTKARRRRDVKAVQRIEAEFVSRNLRYAVSIAKRYCGRGLDLCDLVQEATCGLYRGVQKFDPSRGFRVSTYVGWWCRQACQRAIANDASTIRTPVHVLETSRALRKLEDRYQTVTGEIPSDVELARATKRKAAVVQKARAARAVAYTLSLDAPVNMGDDGQSIARLDMIASESLTPEAIAIQTERDRSVWRMLGNLSERERRVLLARAHGKTLEEASAPFGFTRERARQIESKALEKIRKGERRRERALERRA
jgi:RNA polymerase primary sigma factor